MDQSHGLGNWTPRIESLFLNTYPIHRACRDGDIDCLASLLSTGNVDFYEEDDFFGWTPIHWASYFGKLPCLMKLLECGATCDTPTERLNQTPTHIAAYGGQSHCLKWLIHSGAMLGQQDYLGETACHKAARTGSMECVSLLVSQGAHLDVRNNSGSTPAQVAAASGFRECANYLERAMQIQTQAADVYDEMRTPVTHPSVSSVSPMADPVISNASSPPNVFQTPSDGNLISVNLYHSNPHYIPNGTAFGSGDASNPNGLVHNNNNSSQVEDCDMEMEADAQEESGNLISNGAMADEDPSGGLCSGAWRNGGVQVAGRKRCLENGEEESFKRARSEEPSMPKLNGWLHNNGHMTNHMTSEMKPITESMVEHYKSVSIQQGYDNLVLESVINGFHGS